MTTKFTPLEIEIILDRPEECIVECSCQFYTDEMVAKYGDYNKTENIITEIWENQERKVYPEQKVWDSCDKMVLDDCLSGSTMDRAEEVSPQYHGKVRAAARRCVEKLEKLNVKFSWAERWF